MLWRRRRPSGSAFARELHDDTGQSLTAIGLGVRGAISNLARNPQRAGGQLKQIEDLVTHSLRELQRLIADLRPSHLDDLGLPATLRWYAGELRARDGLQVAIELIGEDEALPGEVATALFRITQEALNNVVRHSGSERASVRVEYLPDYVHLVVCDRGAGFDPVLVRQADRPQWGLLGMQERAVLLGGQLAIDSAPGKGTCVTVVIPRSDSRGGLCRPACYWLTITPWFDPVCACCSRTSRTCRSSAKPVRRPKPCRRSSACSRMSSCWTSVCRTVSGIEVARQMKQRSPATAIVALTIHEDEEYFFKMLEAGAVGYVPKRAAPEELVQAIHAAASGEVYLYPSLAKLLVKDFLTSEGGAAAPRAGRPDRPGAGSAGLAGGRGRQPGDRRSAGHQPQNRLAPP